MAPEETGGPVSWSGDVYGFSVRGSINSSVAPALLAWCASTRVFSNRPDLASVLEGRGIGSDVYVDVRFGSWGPNFRVGLYCKNADKPQQSPQWCDRLGLASSPDPICVMLLSAILRVTPPG